MHSFPHLPYFGRIGLIVEFQVTYWECSGRFLENLLQGFEQGRRPSVYVRYIPIGMTYWEKPRKAPLSQSIFPTSNIPVVP